ncbi:MAG: methyltransferase domain-containing protein [Firmicutes bacterium]|nr:methyltransferase domain-containing protein [Bacillota bacterium]
MINYIDLPGRRFKILSVSDIEILLDRVEDEDQLPFWAQLWPSAQGLARYLWGLQSIKGIKALELGAGTGLCGIAAAVRGARVVQTDYIPDALQFCRANAALNEVEGIAFEIADWRNFQLPGTFPLIFASDILYEPTLHQYLVDVMVQKLAPGGTVVIADPGRRTVMGFLDLAEQAGFIWQVENIAISQNDTGGVIQTIPATSSIDIIKLFLSDPN